MSLSEASIRVSVAYVLVVAGMAAIAMLASWGWAMFAANLLTLPAGTVVLGFLHFLVVPVLDLGYGISGHGPLGPIVMVSGYVVAAVANVVLIVGLVTLCRELRDSRRPARARAAKAST